MTESEIMNAVFSNATPLALLGAVVYLGYRLIGSLVALGDRHLEKIALSLERIAEALESKTSQDD